MIKTDFHINTDTTSQNPTAKASSQFSSVQFLSHVWLFVTPRTAAWQAFLSITDSWSLLKLMSIKSVMPSNHLILYHPLLLLPSVFPSIRVFPVSQFFASGGQSVGASVCHLGPDRFQSVYVVSWTVSFFEKLCSAPFPFVTLAHYLSFSPCCF